MAIDEIKKWLVPSEFHLLFSRFLLVGNVSSLICNFSFSTIINIFSFFVFVVSFKPLSRLGRIFFETNILTMAHNENEVTTNYIKLHNFNKLYMLAKRLVCGSVYNVSFFFFNIELHKIAITKKWLWNRSKMKRRSKIANT